jgi:hypothetical protein
VHERAGCGADLGVGRWSALADVGRMRTADHLRTGLSTVDGSRGANGGPQRSRCRASAGRSWSAHSRRARHGDGSAGRALDTEGTLDVRPDRTDPTDPATAGPDVPIRAPLARRGDARTATEVPPFACSLTHSADVAAVPARALAGAASDCSCATRMINDASAEDARHASAERYYLPANAPVLPPFDCGQRLAPDTVHRCRESWGIRWLGSARTLPCWSGLSWRYLVD